MVRDLYIDILRSIGILCIILAHIYAPHVVTQLRSFDVPLMLFVSGLSFSGKSIKSSLLRFYYTRALRLIIPSYIFLLLFFIIFFLFNHPWSSTYIVNSFLLMDYHSIGYVWIIKVFLLIMLMTPLEIYINNRLSHFQFIFFILILYFLQSFIVKIPVYLSLTPRNTIIYNEIFPNIIGYSIPFLLGLRVKSLTQVEFKKAVSFTIVSALIFICIYVYQNGTELNISSKYKYPPYSYYISYGCLMSLFLWYLRPQLSILNKSRLLLFIGQNTMWIYLWHIPYVLILNRIIDIWYLKYIIVVVMSISTYYVQYRIVSTMQSKFNIAFLKYFKG